MKAKRHALMVAKKETPTQAVITIKTLGKAPEEKTFVLKDGRKLRTVYELVDELETMNDATFREFVNNTKNDFANWIHGVFGDKPLAEEIRRIKDRMETQRAIMKHLVRELKRLGK